MAFSWYSFQIFTASFSGAELRDALVYKIVI
jgi:hypothetical protein